MSTTSTTSTTSSTASAASTATSTAISSLITSLGAGSGIDMTALATNLSVAQFAGRSDRLTTKADTLDKQISAASTLKSMMLTLASSVGDRVRAGDLSPQPTVAASGVASAALSGTSVPSGSYSLEVTTLAARQTLTSPSYATSTSTVGSGTLTLRFGTVTGTSFAADSSHAPVTVTIPPGATLTDTARAINASGSGVTAYVANTGSGAKLMLKGAEGAANGFQLEASETAGDPGLANLAWTPAGDATRLLSQASDAALKIDGLSITSTSNTLSDAIPGVKLTLTGTNAGAPTTVTFADASSAITTAMTDLTSALNTVVTELNTDTDSKTGDLARDGGARALRSAFSSLTGTVVMPNAASGDPSTLADLGLSIQRDGTFKLDTTRLTATLSAHPQAAAAMFTTGVSGVFATIDGLARKATATSSAASLGASIARLTDQQTKNTQDETDLAAAQATLRTQLIARYSTANTQVGSYKSTLSFLQGQIDAWNSNS